MWMNRRLINSKKPLIALFIRCSCVYKSKSFLGLAILVSLLLAMAGPLLVAKPVGADPGYGIVIDDGNGGNVGQYSSIDLDSDGHPHISYYDSTNGDLKYASYNGTDWSIITVDGSGGDDVGQYSSIAIDAWDCPNFSYFDATNGALKYAWKKPDGSWDINIVDNPDISDAGICTSIATDGSCNPHISYIEGYHATWNLKYVRSDVTWDPETVDDSGNVWLSSTSIAVDGNLHPRISYTEDTILKYAYMDADHVWHFETPDPGSIGLYSSLALNIYDRPRISYFDNTNDVLKYASYNGTDWNIEPVDDGSGAIFGIDTSLDLDSDGHPHISCYDSTSGAIKRAYKDASGWHIATVDIVAAGNRPCPSIAVESNRCPHISYYDPTNGDLKYYNGIPDIRVDPVEYNFGAVPVDGSEEYEVSVWNEGCSELVVDNIEVLGDDASQFSIQNDQCSGHIIPLGFGNLHTFEVCFHPTVSDNKTASVYIWSNDPDENPKTIPLTGKGASTAISVTKGGPAISKVGDNVTYWAAITNTGDWPLEKGSVSDNVVTGINGLFSSTLLPGNTDNQSYWYVVQAGDSDPLCNIVTAHYYPEGLTNVISDNATCTVDLVHPDLAISKTTDNTISKVTDTITYTVTVENTGDWPLEKVSVTDSLSVPITGLSNILAAGTSENVSYSYTVQGGDSDPLENTVTAQYRPVGLSNDIIRQANHSVDLVHPNMQVVKWNEPGTYKLGDIISYFTQIRNTSSDITMVRDTVTDSLSGNITSLCPVIVGPGDNITVNYTYTVKTPDPDPLVNLVSVLYHPDGLPNDIADNTTCSIDLAPTITSVTPNQGIRGQTLDIIIAGSQLNRVNAVDFGAGITVIGFTVNGATRVSASIKINATAALGPRDVTVTNPTGSDILTGGFTVNQLASYVPSPSPRASPAPPSPLNPAQLSVKYLSVSPQQTTAGQPVTVTTNVVNTDDEAGNYNVVLKINGQVEQSRMVSVGPQGTQPVKFTITKAQPGTYTVNIDDQKRSFIVTGAGSRPGAEIGEGLLFTAATAVIAVLVVLLIIVARRRFQGY